MSKTWWVLLPLIAFTLWVVARRVFRRPLTRHALNVQQAMLLLIYFAVTSGLGIFWVANQQLPVFDLHYLFGYATVLLVAAHVLINWRLVWGYFAKPAPRKRAAAAASGAASPSSPARGAAAGRWGWGLVTWAATLLLAFALGMRYGSNELRATWTAGGPAPAAAAATSANAADAPPSSLTGGPRDVVDAYHAMSAHDRVGVVLRAPSVDWGDPPQPFKTYPDAAIVHLPPPLRHAPPVSPPLDLMTLSTILFHSFGVTRESGGFLLRAAPSSGALFPTEAYVIARDVAGLAPGVYHYDPQHHRLHRLRDAAPAAAQLGAIDPAAADRAPALFVATSVFRRTGYKYRDRAYRYATADAGHAMENLRRAGRVLGFDVTPLRQFDEARAAETLGVDGVEEGVLAVLALAPAALRTPGAASLLAFQWPPQPDPNAGPLGVTSVVHLATSLRLVEVAPPATRSPATTQAASDLPTGAVTLPPPVASDAPALATMAARRSVRRFQQTPITLVELSSVLHDAARGPDYPLSDAVRVHVLAHRVDSVPPGAYRYDADSHALRPGNLGDLRAASASAALAQDVIGDGAAVVILTLDRAALYARDGARGYRHGFLEAGMLGERVYLAAGARGLGACAVGAFYDAEAARLINIDPAREWVVHFASVGRTAE